MKRAVQYRKKKEFAKCWNNIFDICKGHKQERPSWRIS